jgi:dehydrogenase/reductase SDR family protein 1
MGQAFWEKGVDAWDAVNHVGLRSVRGQLMQAGSAVISVLQHYHASVHAARLMVKTKSKGIIINVSSFGGLNYIFDAAYGIGKVLNRFV